MRKVLIGLGVFVVLLIGTAIAIPYFYKDEIVAEVKKAANEQLNAKLNFSDVDISIFRQFPKLSVGLKDLELTGIGAFDGVKLLSTERLDVGVDLMKALNNEIIVRNLHLEKPSMHVFILKDGQANYDVTKPVEPGTPESAASPIALESYTISDGHIIYEDQSLEMKADLVGLNHKGSGNLGETVYDLTMHTDVASGTVDYGGMRYLSNAKMTWDAVMGMDMVNSKYTFKDNAMEVNDLKMNLDGWVQLPNETDILMDLTFGSPANEFKSLLSIIPGAYTKDFAGVKANGTLAFTGMAKGTYNEHAYPQFKMDFKVGNADFKYPDLPLGVSGINVAALINSPTSNFDNMTVDIPKFSLKIGSNPLAGYFKLRTPMSDPNVDTEIKGDLNFAELAKAFPIEGLQELTGQMKADIAIKAAMSQIDKAEYEKVNMKGAFSLNNMVYRAEGSPAVYISAMEMAFSPQKVDMPRFTAKVGKSDFSAFGSIDNVLAYFSTDKTMTGKLTLRSSLIDANEFMATETTAEPVKTPAEITTEKPFDRWDFTVDGKIDRIDYEDYNMRDLVMDGHFTPNAMDINNFGMKIGNSDLSGSGKIIGASDYMFENRTLRGDINLKSGFFDLNQFMTEEPTAAANTAEVPPADVILIPENVDMRINAEMDKVLYSTYTLTDLDGAVVVKDQQASLENCTASTMGGMVGLNGLYNTQNIAKPTFKMDMAVKDMGFPEVWKNVVTIQQLAPITKFINGKFNTTLSLSGAIGKDMMPDLKTLSAEGFVETINAVLNNFKPLNDIGTKLNVSALKSMDLGTSRNWFTIKDGKIGVKPFNLKAGDVAMAIEGSHGLDTEMDYKILTKTPRSAMEKTAVGAAASGGLKWLSGEASKVGVNVNQGDFINVQFNLTGSITAPKLGIKVLGSDGESTLKDEAKATAVAAADKAKDSLRNVANRELDAAKGKVTAAVNKAKDSLQNLANQKVQEAKDKAVGTVKTEVGKVLDKEIGDKVGDKVGDAIGDKATEVLGEGADKKLEDAKDKLKDFNPFGKKKKGN